MRSIRHALLIITLAVGAVSAAEAAHSSELATPNVVLILADDLGFSDLSCFGSEIPTPNLDRLAAGGIRFTELTNTSKCFPSRACLLTGAYAQAVGMGRQPGKIKGARTVAEVMRSAGYQTLMTGKHHGTQNPVDLGFDRYFGLRDGACNYFNPGAARPGEPNPAQKRKKRAWCIDQETFAPYSPEDPDFYTTDAFTDAALAFLDDTSEQDRPFFLYVAYNAPHDPLQAPIADIERHQGIYDVGYEAIRNARLDRQRALGLFEGELIASPAEHGPWDELSTEERTDQSRRMQVYAAMIDRMDQNIGRLIDKLEQLDAFDSTLILFASDNGASAEDVNIGEGEIGSIDRWSSLQRRWANVSNTPFRKFKNHTLEGGIRTPGIAHWPDGIKNPGRNVNEPAHLIDVLPTLAALAKTDETESSRSNRAGVSLVPLLRDKPLQRSRPLYYQWQRGRAIRDGRYKLVQHGKEPWRLYDLLEDRIEAHDLAERFPDRCLQMRNAWEAWRDDPGFESH